MSPILCLKASISSDRWAWAPVLYAARRRIGGARSCAFLLIISRSPNEYMAIEFAALQKALLFAISDERKEVPPSRLLMYYAGLSESVMCM